MIHVRMTALPDGRLASFEMDGHAEFAAYGSDLVCAGASAVAFGAVNAMMEIAGVEPSIEQGAEGGHLAVSLPSDIDDETKRQLQTIMQTLLVSLQTIERDYGDYIKITFNH